MLQDQFEERRKSEIDSTEACPVIKDWGAHGEGTRFESQWWAKNEKIIKQYVSIKREVRTYIKETSSNIWEITTTRIYIEEHSVFCCTNSVLLHYCSSLHILIGPCTKLRTNFTSEGS